MKAQFWQSCPQVEINPHVVHGQPVFRGTRLPVDAIMENVDAFMDIEGQTLDEAIDSTLECFPGTPGGADGIRYLLEYRTAHQSVLQP